MQSVNKMYFALKLTVFSGSYSMTINLFFAILYFRFDWFVPEDQLKERTLDITVKNDVSFFSKSKTSMGQVFAVLMTFSGM